MAQETEVDVPRALPYGVLALSLSDAIVTLGIPSLEMGLAAAQAGLTRFAAESDTSSLHFEWNKEALDKLPLNVLEQLLLNLRDAVGVTQ